MGKMIMSILKAMATSGLIVLWIGLDSITTMLIG